MENGIDVPMPMTLTDDDSVNEMLSRRSSMLPHILRRRSLSAPLKRSSQTRKDNSIDAIQRANSPSDLTPATTHQMRVRTMGRQLSLAP